MNAEKPVPGSAWLQLVNGVPLLHPGEQVFEAMLTGWRNQQLARNLAFSTIEGRENQVRAFARHCERFPWEWSPQLAGEWFTGIRAVRGNARPTLRSCQVALRLFCAFAVDPAYGWAGQCQIRFGTHPIQVVHEWNTAVHVQDHEADARKRAFTKAGLHAFFAHCDDQVARARAFGRKGWLPAFRDATVFKTAYAFGLFSGVRLLREGLASRVCAVQRLLTDKLSAAAVVVQGPARRVIGAGSCG